MKRKLRQLLAIMLIVVICTCTIDVSVFATESTTNTWDGIATERIYEGEIPMGTVCLMARK